jgi:type II secretory pathway pseudopilin PulG
MEVLLALALFVSAAAVVTSALNSSIESLDRQRQGVHALNLASSALAEMQLGIRPIAPESRQSFPLPFQEWNREVLVSPMESEGTEPSGLVRVEVVIRHQTAPVVQRLAQVLKPLGVSSTNLPPVLSSPLPP